MNEDERWKRRTGRRGEEEVEEEKEEEKISGKHVAERKNKAGGISLRFKPAILQLRLTGHKTTVPRPHHSPQTVGDTRHNEYSLFFSPRSHSQSPVPELSIPDCSMGILIGQFELTNQPKNHSTHLPIPTSF